MPDISIVICTYNPTPATFQRVLAAVSALAIPIGHSVECCLVDNNSQPPVREAVYVQDFLTRTPWAKAITEPTQGLSAARWAGVAATSAPVVVFLDDDNQPEPDYIANLLGLLKQYPQVGVWGPGDIQVEFTEAVDPWIQHHKWLFQERHTDKVAFGREQHWTAHHPGGTGQTVRRDVMLHYKELVDTHVATLTGRSGKSLASGEDAQVIYTAIKLGYDVGIAPGLTVHHLIPKKRTHISYVKKLLYNIMSTGAIANVEIFPDQKAYYYTNISSSRKIFINIIKIIGSSVRDRSLTLFQMNSGTYLGRLAGSYEVVSGKIPYWLTLYVRLLKLHDS